MTNPAPSSRRAARIRQIRERQRGERGGGSAAVGRGSQAVSASSGAQSTADDAGAAAGAASKSGNEDVGIAATPSMMSEGDASSVASGRSSRLTKGQRAAAYRARKLAKARAASAVASADGSTAAAAATPTTTGTAAASHPPHPPSSIPMPKSSNMVESPRQSNRPGSTSSIQIESAMSSASDVMSTASSFTTASQMTAKATNSRDRGTGSSTRPASAPRAGRSRAPSPSVASESTSSRSSTSKGGSRAASVQKLRAQSPALLRRASSHGGGSSVSSSRSRSRSVDNKTASPTPPPPIDTAKVERSSGNVSPAPASNIDFETPISPSSPVSTASSKSEHLSVEKGIRLIKTLQNQSTTSPSVSTGRPPSPSPRSRNFSSSSPRGSLGPIEERGRQSERQEMRASRDPDAVDDSSREPSSSFSRPDPPRESSTPPRGSGSAWDRAHQAVQAQMDAAQEILDGSPSDDTAALRKAIEPEEVREPSIPAPDPSASVPAPGPHLQQSKPEHDAKVLAEQEVRQLEARATEMKRRMERQAEILGRQEMEMVRNEEQPQYPDSLSQDYLPPHIPPSPQFFNQQQWEHEPPLQHNDQFSEAGSSIPPPPISSSPYPTFPPTTNNMPFATAPVTSPPDHPYGVPGSSGASMQQRGSGGYVEPPTSSSIHPQSPSSWQQPQQESLPSSYQSHGVGQKYPAPPQEQGPYYHHQQPPQLTDVGSYQPQAVDPYQAGASMEEKYRQYTLSPPSQGGSTLPGQAQAHGMPAALPYYQDPSMAAAHSQHRQQSFAHHPPMQGNETVAHMHYESHREKYSYNETNTNMSSGVNSNHQQQSRGTIESMAVHPHMQQYSYASKAAPREASEANASESSYEASSISHLTASTLGTAAPRDPPISSEQAKADTPTYPRDDFPMERAPFEEERKRPVAPVMSPQEFKAPKAAGFETDAESMFDDPTFSPQSAENQSVASKAMSDASKSGMSWWKDTDGDAQRGDVSNAAEGSKLTSAKDKTHTNGSPHSQSRAHSVAQSLGTVEESSGLDAAGFPIPSPSAKSKTTTSSLPPVRSPSPMATNGVASGQASHFTAGSAASVGSLGMRLAANLNIDADDDEDIFSGIESPTSKELLVEPKPLDNAASLPNDDIFDGVASPNDSSKMSAAGTSASSKVSAAVKSRISAGTESKASAALNTVEEPKALVDDATSFIGTASLGASKRSSSNLDGSGQNTLNMEYSNSTRENSEKVINGANGDFSSPLNEPPTDGVLGMSTGNNATQLNEASASDVLRMDNTGTSDNQFFMEMSSKDILEFATHDVMGDAGTITSDITSSIIDMGPAAKKEAYDAHANAQASKYEPMTSPIAEAEESKSRASVVAHSTATEEDEAEKAPESSTFDGSSNYEDEETYDPSATQGTLDSGRDRKSSRRRKHEKKKRRDRGHKSSRRRYEGSDDSYSDGYDDFTRGGSTVMTSISRDSTTSGAYSQMGLFSRYGCGVLDALTANCGAPGPPNSFDDRSLDGDETYNEETVESFDKTIDSSTLNGTASALKGGKGLSVQEQKVWDAWDKKDSSETMNEETAQSVENKSIGTAAHLEELELRQRRAQHLERRARAHEKLLLHAYSAMSLPPPPPGVEKGEEQASSGTPTSNSSSNEENKEPEEESRRSVTASVDSDNDEESKPYSTGAREAPPPLKPQSPMQIKPKPPSAPTGSKMLAAKSAILQRQTLEKFCIRLKNQGMGVMKMNHNKKWQDRVLTVSKEVNYLSQDKDSIFSDLLPCPQGLLWAKKFNTKTREHSVSDIDKTGKGGMLLQSLQGASLGNVADYPLARKQLQGEFKDSVVVVLHAAESGYPGNLRDIVLRCKSMEEATFLCSGCKAIAEILYRDAEAKVVKGSSVAGQGSPIPKVLSPSTLNGTDTKWEM